MTSIVEDLVESVQSSISSENWVAALTIALTLPDICAKVDGSYGTLSGDRYASWFEQYVSTLAQPIDMKSNQYNFFSGKDCYALRCAFLHEGDMVITGRKAQEFVDAFSFIVAKNYLWSVSSGEKVKIEIHLVLFCEDICRGVTNWLASIAENEDIKSKLNRLPRIQIIKTECFS